METYVLCVLYLGDDSAIGYYHYYSLDDLKEFIQELQATNPAGTVEFKVYKEFKL